MAIKTRDELMNSIRTALGDDTSDTAISLLEDVQDTLNSYTETDTEDWKQKYEDNDREWRTKYRERFFSGSDDDGTPDVSVPDKKLKFEDLFKE